MPEEPESDEIDEMDAEGADNAPPTPGQHFRSAFRQFIWPRTLKGAFLVMAAQQVFHFGTGLMMYPTAKQTLIKEGFSETAAGKIAPFRPALIERVPQEQNALETTHDILTSNPFLPGIALSAWRNLSTSAGQTLARTLGCDIHVQSPEKFDARSVLSQYLWVKPESIRDLPVTNDEIRQYFLAHEIGHCDVTQSYLGTLPTLFSFLPEKAKDLTGPFNRWITGIDHKNERHSDFTAVDAMGEKAGNRRIEEFALYLRATNGAYILNSDLDYDHDLALEIDARMHGKTLPTMKEIMDSRKELVGVIQGILRERNAEFSVSRRVIPDRLKPAPEVDNDNSAAWGITLVAQALIDHGDTMSPWAVRRAQLYLKGGHYFMPDVVNKYLPGLFPAEKTAAAPGNFMPSRTPG